jgi:hypothetical protein
MDLETFRAERDQAITRTAARHRAAVESALTGDDIARDLRLAAADTYTALHPGASRQRVAAYLRAIRPALTKTTAESDPTVVAEWLAVAAINYAAVSQAPAGSRKEWVTMRDNDVRDGHAVVHGQTRVLGGKFLVMGERLRYPGEPKGDPAVWINCRCVIRVTPVTVTSLTAGADSTGAVIVALPAADDPIHQASSEQPAHMTLVYLGKYDALDDTDALAAAVAGVAVDEGTQPATLPVAKRGTLGDDDADVLFLDPGSMTAIRDALLADPVIRAAYDSAEQFPQWTPHLTLGYPESPATGEPSDTIRFDRLALWLGPDQQEFTMDDDLDPADAMPDEDMMDDEQEPVITEADLSHEPLRWHGVLAPEGEWSGDKRRFAEGSMSWRDLPLPLSWQKVNSSGHDGSVVVGSIQNIERRGNLLHASGVWASTPEADEVIGLLAEGHLRGVSVDVDDANITMGDADNGDPHDQSMTIDKGRICGATICAIPAFAQAFVSLGDEEVEALAADGQVTVEDAIAEAEVFRDYSPEERRRLADEGKAMPDGSFPIVTVDDLHNAIQAIGRASDPEAVKRHIKKRARELDQPDLIPDTWAVDAEEFAGPVPRGPGDKRGPGWVTEPKATRRIHDYWTDPKKPGFRKIGWGAPGDFDRCRKQLAKYVGPAYLNRTCAEWHKDALGYWPSQHKKMLGGHAGETVEATVEDCDECSQSVVLVAAAAPVLPAAAFADPGLAGPTALTIDGERVFGHLALWDTCHIGFGEKVCVTAPHSQAQYAYFTTGTVLTDAGRIPVGQITMNTGHASHEASARSAAAHYDHTGAAVADVAVGEDAHGIWFSGVLRSGVTDAQRHALEAAALSGDWRGIRGNLELVAALAVNVPGFPVPRVSLAASGGQQTALVAAGIIPQPAATLTLDTDVEATARRVVEMLREDAARTERARIVAADAKRVRLDILSERV